MLAVFLTSISSGTDSGRTSLALRVGSSKSGVTTATARSSGTGRRTRSSGSTVRIRINPPSREGATLSACLPETAASASMQGCSSSGFRSGEPRTRFTANAAAAALAAELPSPDPMGSPFSSTSSTPISMPAFFSVSVAAMPAVLDAASRESFPSSPVIFLIVTPLPGVRRAVTLSPGSKRARPRMSKPRPRLATVAGANAVTLLSWEKRTFTSVRRRREGCRRARPWR